MKKHKEKIIAVVVFILANIICPIFVSKVENIDFINAFITMWKAIWQFILNILTFSIPIWVIIITIIIIYIFIKIYLMVIEIEEDNSWYEKYSRDKYDGLLYEWKYNRIDNKIEMIDVTPICENCKGNVLPRDVGYNTILYCPNCNKTYKRPNKEEYDSARVYFNNKLKKTIDEHNKNQE